MGADCVSGATERRERVSGMAEAGDCVAARRRDRASRAAEGAGSA
ncbi:hypothetical protein [Nocardia sp. NRRL S-836]|nr:hypothetical protein [Nocardia sp. NRRL S-836]